MISVFLLFTTFTIFVSCASESARKIICNSSQTIYLNPDELNFIESPNFPKTMDFDCEMTFVAQNFQNPNNLHIIVALTNAVLANAVVYSHDTRWMYDNINTNTKYINFVAATNTTELKLYTEIDDSYNAFQGFVMLDDFGLGCPLLSIAHFTPFEFKDDTEIIYLISKYFRDYNSQFLYHSNCVWKFIAPAGYKFKLILNSLGENNVTVTSGLNGLPLIIDDVFKVYHFDDNFLTISYHTASFGNFDYFDGYLTIVEKRVHKINDNCQILQNETTTIWSNIDVAKSGYPKNAECSFNLTIPLGKEIYVIFEFMNIESKGDIISYYYRDEWQIFDASRVIILQPNANELRNKVLWKFVSDGNVQSEGFRIIFEEKACKCSDSEVITPCEGSSDYRIMEDEDGTYCGNFVCNFTIVANASCPSKYLYFTITVFNLNYYDEFNLYSNGKMYDAKFWNSVNINSILFSPNNIYFINFKSLVYGTWNGRFIYRLTAVDAPTFLSPTKLHISNPIFALFMVDYPVNTIFTISFDDELIKFGDTLELYSNAQNFQYLTFYSDETLSMVVEYIKGFAPDPSSPSSNYSYFIQNNKLTIHKHKEGSDMLFFRATKSQSKNCRFSNSIFYICNPINVRSQILTNLADENGDCKVILLNCPSSCGIQYCFDYNAIGSVWTTSKNDTVKIYGENSKLFFSFNANDAFMWKDVILNSYIYTVNIPANSSILIKFVHIHDGFTVDTYPFKTLWTTIYYGHPTPTDISTVPMLGYSFNTTSISDEVLITLTILEFNVSTIWDVRIGRDDTTDLNGTINVPATFSFIDSGFLIIYWQNGPGINDVLIQIEAIKLNGTSTRTTRMPTTFLQPSTTTTTPYLLNFGENSNNNGKENLLIPFI